MKSSWRDAILNDFVPNVSKLTLVADPDCLLTEEKLALELRGRGFDLIEFSDPVEFRYAYESKYRSIWDRGEHTDLKFRGHHTYFLTPYEEQIEFWSGAELPELLFQRHV